MYKANPLYVAISRKIDRLIRDIYEAEKKNRLSAALFEKKWQEVYALQDMLR